MFGQHSGTELGGRFVEWLGIFLNWGRIRAIGELQILTRASYGALIIVPVISGVWPALRVSINHYNEAAAEASSIFQQTNESVTSSIERLHNLLANLPSGSQIAGDLLSAEADFLGEQRRLVTARVDAFTERFDPQTLDAPDMPLVWVFAFLSAMAIVAGHLIYQASAPDVIRSSTKAQYKQAAKDAAIGAGKRQKSEIQHTEAEAAEYYEQCALSGSVWTRSLSALLYLLGIGLLSAVLFLQTKSVLDAAGLV